MPVHKGQASREGDILLGGEEKKISNYYKQSMKSERRCIFCRGKGMTKEHFWPKWVGPFLKRHAENKYTSELYKARGKTTPKLSHKRDKPGNLFTQKIRVVCGACNNGWMSQLEESAKPYLLGILEKKNLTINSDGQGTLAKWIAMKIMVAEHSEEDKVVTPESDRFEFFSTRKIPEYYRIFIGIHDSPSDSAYIRHAMTIALSSAGPNPPLDGQYGNTQSVSFLFGPLCVHVIASRIAGYDFASNFVFTTLQRIWPMDREAIEWPLKIVTTTDSLRTIGNSLDLLINTPRVKAIDLPQ